MSDIKRLFLCAAAGIFLFSLAAAENAPAKAVSVIYGRNKRTATFRLPGGVVLRMMKIKAGSFIMGSPDEEVGRISQEKQHRVIISREFWMGRYEVTQGQYRAVMGSNPSYFKDGDDYPVEQVSWDDAMKFCAELNKLFAGQLPLGYAFDLPTEAQWEYACRAGSTTAFNNGKDLVDDVEASRDLDQVAWYFKNSGKTTHPVGEKRPNAWGLYDMHGNVWEWCRDSFVNYSGEGEIEIDPIRLVVSSLCVDRGGGWDDNPKYCRSAFRNRSYSGRKYHIRGFRVALAPVKKKDQTPEGRSNRRTDAEKLALELSQYQEDGFTLFEETVALIPDSPRLNEIKDALAHYAAATILSVSKVDEGFAIFQKVIAAIPDHPGLKKVKNALADFAARKIRGAANMEDGIAIFKKTAAAIPDHPKLTDVRNALSDHAAQRIRQSAKIEDAIAVCQKIAAAIPDFPKLGVLKDALADSAIAQIRQSAKIEGGFAVFKKTAAAIPDHPKLEDVKEALTDYAIAKARKSFRYDEGLAILDKTIAVLPNYPRLRKERNTLAEEMRTAKEIEEKIEVASRAASKEEEIEKLKSIVKEYPKHPLAQIKVQNLIREKEEYLAACKAIQEALLKAKDPRNRSEACDILEEVIEKYPKNEFIKDAKAYLQELVQENRVVIRQIKINEGDAKPQILIQRKSGKWVVLVFPMDRKSEVQRYLQAQQKWHESLSKNRIGEAEKYHSQLSALEGQWSVEAKSAMNDVSTANLRPAVFRSDQCRLANITDPVIFLALTADEVKGRIPVKYMEYVPPTPKEIVLE